MADSRKYPKYSLTEIKNLVKDGKRYIPFQTTTDADYIGYKHHDIYAVILDLKEAHFYKSMESKKNPLLWQDVYHYTRDGVDMVLYVKLQIKKKAVVVSFKEK